MVKPISVLRLVPSTGPMYWPLVRFSFGLHSN